MGCLSEALGAEAFSMEKLLSLLQTGELSSCVRYFESTTGPARQTPDALYVASVCALRTNRPISAQRFAQEALDQAPNYAGAWFVKAQADYLLRDGASLAVSRRALASASVPSEQRNAAATWLQSLKQSETRTQLSLAAEVGFGHSTNANAGTSESDYLGTPIPGSAKQTPSAFFDAALDASVTKPYGLFKRVFVATEIARRFNPDAPSADQTVMSLVIGYQVPVRQTMFTYSIKGFDEYVDGKPQRLFATADVVASRRISDFSEVEVGLRVGRLNFRIPTRPDLDVWRAVWSANLTRIVGRTGKAKLGAGVFGGGDEEVVFRSSFGNTRIGVRAFADLPIDNHLELRGEATASATEFDVHGGFAGITRRDNQIAVGLAATWRPSNTSKWRIEARAVRRKLSSNVQVFSFDQDSVGIWVRYAGG